MARLNTTQNYVIREGTLFENFETLGDWTAAGSGGGSVVADSTNYKTGTKSLGLSASNGYENATKTVSLPGTNLDVIGFWTYVPDITNLYSLTVYLSSSTTLTTFFSIQTLKQKLRNGWNFVSIARSDWTNSGELWTNTFVRLRVRLDTIGGVSSSASFDSFYYGIYARPKVIIVFDDGRASAYTQAFSYMQSHNMKGTIAVNPANVGNSTWMTLSQLHEVHDAGWDMANHGYTHPHMPLLSPSEQLSEITTVTDWLLTNGFDLNRGSKHFVFPYGEYNDSALEAVTLAGMYTARSTKSANQSTVKGIDNSRLLYGRGLNMDISLATAKSYVDNCIETGTSLHFLGHQLATTPVDSTEWPIADFQALIDYIALKRDSGLLDVMTISQWYDGLTSSRLPSYSRQSTAINRLPLGELVFNGDFEYVPPFVAATTSVNRWIDGTASGSTNNSTWGWYLSLVTGSGSARFDTTHKKNGQHSLKLSATATGSEVNVTILSASGLLLSPSTSYTATISIKTTALSGSALSGARVDFAERNMAGTYIKSNVTPAVTTTTDMTTYTIVFTTDSTTRRITPKIVVKGNDGAGNLIMDAWFDDISILPTVSPDRMAVT